MRRKCDVCGSISFKLHSFPSNEQRAFEWARCLGWTDGLRNAMERKQLKCVLLCSRHFADTSYVVVNDQERLKTGANPISVENPPPVTSAAKEQLPPILERMDCFPMEEVESVISSPLKRRAVEGPQTASVSCSQLSVCSQVTEVEEGTLTLQTSKKYFLCSSASILGLVKGCLSCGDRSASRKVYGEGSTLLISTDCFECGIHKWSSTPKAHEDPLGAYYEGNLDLITSAHISGIPHERLCDWSTTMDLSVPNKTSYYKVLKTLIRPVVLDKYNIVMEECREKIKEYSRVSKGKHQIAIIGDAQFDSRGFSADICRYTMMDANTKMVMDWSVVQKKESGGNSPILEKMGFDRVMSVLTKDPEFKIVELTTDQHKGILAHTKKKFPDIKHTTDKWHKIKNFKKNNEKKIKLKRNASLRVFWIHLLRHIYVSISAANGNSKLALELIQSAEYHLQGIHKFPKKKFKYIRECLHDDLGADRAYLDPVADKQQIKVLHDMLYDPAFVSGILLCSANNTTSALESFHSVVANIYIQKNHYFGKESTEHLMRLAVLHQNCHRLEILEWKENMHYAAKELPQKEKYSRAQGRTVSVTKNPAPTNAFKREIVEELKQFYRMRKDKEVAQRRNKSSDPGSNDDENNEGSDEKEIEGDGADSDADDDANRDSDEEDDSIGSDEDEDEDSSDIDEEDGNSASDEDGSSNLDQEEAGTELDAVTQRSVLYIHKKDLRKVMDALGQDADSYDIYDADSGDILLPI